MKGGRIFCGKRRVIFIDNIKEETGDYRRYRGGGGKSKEANWKTNKKLQVDNYVIQTTCIELQEEVTKKVK